ncbi:hypothetical protein BDV96DRAFT_221165 [Lophiotrema nucula]|uniref:Uncharacterized protein n=1 Tax=Lophiotrema nucula TaxID=690887 RepID=A0A6A5YVJ7_9PLEO|nr:hypothetical protein BDV96DRAFT_221165 [Lophiotrema nucula]
MASAVTDALTENGYARWAPLVYPRFSYEPKSPGRKQVHFESRPPTRKDFSHPDPKPPEDPEIRRLIERGTVTEEDYAAQRAAWASLEKKNRERQSTVTETEVAADGEDPPPYSPSYFLKDPDLVGVDSDEDYTAMDEAILASEEQYRKEEAQRALRVTNPSPEVEMTDVDDAEAEDTAPEASGTATRSRETAASSSGSADTSPKMSDRKDSKVAQTESESNTDGGGNM